MAVVIKMAVAQWINFIEPHLCRPETADPRVRGGSKEQNWGK